MKNPSATLGPQPCETDAHRRMWSMGLCVDADFDFATPGWLDHTGAPDVTIVQGSCFPSAGSDARPFWQGATGGGRFSGFQDANGVQIHIAGVGRYWFRPNGRLVTYELEADCPKSDAQHWFGSLVVGVAAQLQRRTVLHASGVVIDGHGVAFIAPSGSGKTTLAASFGQCGFPLLSEDSLPVRVEPEGVIATPYVPGIRLWPESVAELVGAEAEYEPALSWLTKKRVPVGGECGRAAVGDVPLKVIYDLSPNKDGIGPVEIGDAEGTARLVRLLGATYFPSILAPRQQVQLMDRLQTVADAVRMRRITYPRRFDALPALREAIIRDATEVANGRL